jgi:hypothetical protein
MKRLFPIKLQILYWIIGIFIITACNPANTDIQSEPEETLVSERERQAILQASPTTLTPSPQVTEQPDPHYSTESPLPLEEIPPTEQISTDVDATVSVRTELEATDPSLVRLASGKVQLIEFFAFW